MRPQSLTQTGTGQSDPVKPDWEQASYNVGVMVVPGAAATLDVEGTCDDIEDSSITPVWVALPGLSALTANTLVSTTVPVRAIRLNQTAGASTSRAVLIQGRTV